MTSAVKAKSALPQNPVTQSLYDYATCSRRDEVAQPTLEIDYEDDEADEDDLHDSGRHPTLFRESSPPSFEPTPRGSSLRQKVTGHNCFQLHTMHITSSWQASISLHFFSLWFAKGERARCCFKYFFMHISIYPRMWWLSFLIWYSAPACYGSSLCSYPDISQNYKMGDISKGTANTHSSPPKKCIQKNF